MSLDGRRCSTTALPCLPSSKRAGRPSRASSPGPARTTTSLSGCCKSPPARPTTASSRRGASSSSPTSSATRLSALLREALDAEDPDATSAHHAKAFDFAHYAGSLVVLVSAPDPRPQDPGVRAGAVVRRGGHEPAARRPCDGLCRRLGDRLGGLFAEGGSGLLRARRADRRLRLHRPARRRTSSSGRARRSRTSSATGPRLLVDEPLRCCIMTA